MLHELEIEAGGLRRGDEWYNEGELRPTWERVETVEPESDYDQTFICVNGRWWYGADSLVRVRR